MIPQTNLPNARPRSFNVLNTLVKFHAFPEETEQKFCLIEATIPVGGAVPSHSHAGETEAFFVLEGEVRFLMGAIGPKEKIARAGDFVAIPDGAVHSFEVIGDTHARMMVINAPGHAHTAFFTAIGDVVPETTTMPGAPVAPDFARVFSEASKAGINLVD